MARILITSALPYINGVKHLGNLAGSMLPADVYARYNRAAGNEVLFICATDEHGTPAELAAIVAGERIDDVVLAYSDLPYAEVMHLAAVAQAAGASFRLLGPNDTMLASTSGGSIVYGPICMGRGF